MMIPPQEEKHICAKGRCDWELPTKELLKDFKQWHPIKKEECKEMCESKKAYSR